MKITGGTISYRRSLDLGYAPYMRYLESLNGKGAPFGMRMNGESADIFKSYQFEAEAGDDIPALTAKLVDQLREEVDGKLREYYPDGWLAPLPGDDEFTGATVVLEVAEDDF